jgi:hypothetical protein
VELNPFILSDAFFPVLAFRFTTSGFCFEAVLSGQNLVLLLLLLFISTANGSSFGGRSIIIRHDEKEREREKKR